MMQVNMKSLNPDFDWRTLSPDERMTTNIVPDRLCVEPASEFYCPIFMRRVGVKLDDAVQNRVVEYCMSEGWVRLHTNTIRKVKVSRHGKVVAFKKHGKVRAYLQGKLVVVDPGGKGQPTQYQLVEDNGTTRDLP